jgi:conjugal transfer pilin signal peptidase TrbI
MVALHLPLSFNRLMPHFVKWLNRGLLLVSVVLAWGFFSGFRIAYDPQEFVCLPNMRLSILHEQAPRNVNKGDIVFWSPHGSAPLAERNLPMPYAIKRVAGIAGDQVRVSPEGVTINGTKVAAGTALMKFYPDFKNKDFVIGQDEFFLVGEHALSDDSRYWGVMPRKFILGKAYGLF